MKLNIELFWLKVIKNCENGCWNWIAAKCDGYGLFNVEGRMKRSSRISWELHNGPILNDLFVLHKCDNRACVNPDHLFLGTNKDNSDDKIKKQRQARGETQGKSKLTYKQVEDIRFKYSNGVTQKELTKEYKVNKSQIHYIVRRKQWKHI